MPPKRTLTTPAGEAPPAKRARAGSAAARSSTTTSRKSRRATEAVLSAGRASRKGTAQPAAPPTRRAGASTRSTTVPDQNDDVVADEGEEIEGHNRGGTMEDVAEPAVLLTTTARRRTSKAEAKRGKRRVKTEASEANGALTTGNAFEEDYGQNPADASETNAVPVGEGLEIDVASARSTPDTSAQPAVIPSFGRHAPDNNDAQPGNCQTGVNAGWIEDQVPSTDESIDVSSFEIESQRGPRLPSEDTTNSRYLTFTATQHQTFRELTYQNAELVSNLLSILADHVRGRLVCYDGGMTTDLGDSLEKLAQNVGERESFAPIQAPDSEADVHNQNKTASSDQDKQASVHVVSRSPRYSPTTEDELRSCNNHVDSLQGQLKDNRNTLSLTQAEVKTCKASIETSKMDLKRRSDEATGKIASLQQQLAESVQRRQTAPEWFGSYDELERKRDELKDKEKRLKDARIQIRDLSRQLVACEQILLNEYPSVTSSDQRKQRYGDLRTEVDLRDVIASMNDQAAKHEQNIEASPGRNRAAAWTDHPYPWSFKSG